MKNKSRVWGAIWCQVILLRLDGQDTKTIEYLLTELEREIFGEKSVR